MQAKNSTTDDHPINDKDSPKDSDEKEQALRDMSSLFGSFYFSDK